MITLCLSKATVMMVREDMKAATQGTVFTSLDRYVHDMSMVGYMGYCYLQDRGEEDRGNCLLRASIRVNGIETERIRSDSARLKMKMFRAVLNFLLFRTEEITKVLIVAKMKRQ